MIAPIIDIETAMVERLKYHTQAPVRSGYRWPFSVKLIDGYGGQFENPEEMAQAAAKAPALFVAYEGETGRHDGQMFVSRMAWAVFALAKSYKPEELRRGGPGVVGLYQLIEAVRLALANQTLGLPMNPLEMQDVRPLWRGGPQGGGISLAVIRFAVEVAWELPPNTELDFKLCPAPVGVAEFDLGGRGIIKAKDYWRIADEYPDRETQAGPESAGPGSDPADPAAPGRPPGG